MLAVPPATPTLTILTKLLPSHKRIHERSNSSLPPADVLLPAHLLAHLLDEVGKVGWTDGWIGWVSDHGSQAIKDEVLVCVVRGRREEAGPIACGQRTPTPSLLASQTRVDTSPSNEPGPGLCGVNYSYPALLKSTGMGMKPHPILQNLPHSSVIFVVALLPDPHNRI